MMFVFGEVSEPLIETINLVEDIVRSQVIEIVRTIQIVNSTIISYLQFINIYHLIRLYRRPLKLQSVVLDI